MSTPLSLKTRLGLLVIDIAILLAASMIAFGKVVPTNDDRGLWFYTALLGLLLGSRLDTPFFVTPADVVLYAAPAAIALLLASSWPTWPAEVRAGFAVALGYCILCLLLGGVAIVTHGWAGERWQRTSNVSRILAESLGTPRIIYSVVVFFALFAFHRSAPKEFISIASAWIVTGVLSPAEGALLLLRRLRRAFRATSISGQDGEVAAFQTPGVILIRQGRSAAIRPGDTLAIRDAVGTSKLARALDYVGRDEGVLIRAVELPLKSSASLTADLVGLSPNGVVRLADSAYELDDEVKAIADNASVVGLVAPDNSIERLFFEVVADDELEEGRLVEVRVRKRPVLYQIVNGLTKEEVVKQRNTHGYARAQAQKVGIWDHQTERFLVVKWLPRPNALVLLVPASDAAIKRDAIGHFPGTGYSVGLKSTSQLVTHNTAILGILGVGKSSLAFELVERLVYDGVKVICVDITGQYETELSLFVDTTKQQQAVSVLNAAAAGGKTNYKQNVAEGGSRSAFFAKLRAVVAGFLAPTNPTPVFVLNPAAFDVWRQDSKMFQDKASMVSVTPAEVTHMICEAALEAVAAQGTTDKARLCIVLEEAHALVPEWNSTIEDADRSASNGTARAVLQGRKYGMGCILITQRTANVTKTILNQCNSVFAMRTFDDTGKGFLANYVGSDYAEALPSLAERHAVFFGRASSCENPVLIRLNDRKDFIAAFRTAPAAAQPVSGTNPSPAPA